MSSRGPLTERKHFKQLVRARMAKTGESYSSARRHILRQAPELGSGIPPLHHYPGSTPGPTALRALLSHAGVRAPHTGAPFSEAMVFGIAGGIGAGMFTFHYARENVSSFFVAGRHLWHDHAAWALAAVKRMGLKAVVKESSGVKPGEKHLRELLDGGRPVMTWLTFRGKMYHIVTVHAIDDAKGTALVGDLADEPIPVPLAELAAARARVKKDRNRLLALEPSRRAPELENLVRQGIAACVDGLAGGRIKNFTLQAFATWADRLDGSRAPDGWEKIFPPGPHLFQGLRSVTEYVEHNGTGGGLCRPLFAEFLEEAGSAVEDRRLTALAARYRELGREWTALAEAALPDDVPAFRDAKELLGRKGEAESGQAEVQDRGRSECRQAMDALAGRMKEEFPLDAAGSAALRRELKRRVTALYEAEVAALGELGKAAGSTRG